MLPSGEDEKGRRVSPLAFLAVVLIRGYQIFISPLLGARCRFQPTCSQYAIAVFREWGFFRGSWLTMKRLLKCGPWHEGGYDPPPLRTRNQEDAGTPPR
ncbi:MAG: membrane protein insertion efficiency factor YidD [Fretibacterium sp.]|nr:membrane protein insertion efficiency factor YidD [Fretibacterium sp.]